MTATPVEQTLQETMHRFESALLAPVVGGELMTWINGVREASATFGLDWTRYLRSVLHVQYDEIAKVDPELLHQVDQMVETDEQLDAIVRPRTVRIRVPIPRIGG